MADPRHALGRLAEGATERWLHDAGWDVVARRYRPPVDGGGELDLVAVDPAGVLVAIEVRARQSIRAGTPAQSVDARRIVRLRRSLAAFGAASRRSHAGLRVDLVSCEPHPALRGSWRLTRTAGIG